MTINKIRSWLYWFAKLLGDVQAVRRGRVVERIENRAIGKLNRKLMRKIWG